MTRSLHRDSGRTWRSSHAQSDITEKSVVWRRDICIETHAYKSASAAATEELTRRLPETRVLLLTSFATADGIARALDAGAAGVVMKDATNSALIEATRAVAAGRRAVSPEVERLLQSDPPAQALTPRQAEVLQSMTRGLTNRDIAKQLSISEDRVEQHVRTLLVKLGAANHTEAVALAFRKHLLKI